MKLIRLSLLVVTLLTISTSSWAKPRTKAEMVFLANKVLNNDNVNRAKGSQPQQSLTLVLEKEAFSVYATSPKGNGKLSEGGSSPTGGSGDRGLKGSFAIISNDDLLPEVLGYSDTAFDPELKNPNFRWWLETMNNACKYYISNGTTALSVTPGAGVEASVSPMVTSRWGQEAPYYNMCPIGTSSDTSWSYQTTGRCVTGCVATAMAQILYYHQAPKHGQGSIHSVRVKQKDGSYDTYSVDYDEAVYDWDNMLDRYTEGNYTKVQGDAVAQLMYHCGVAADMVYGTDGSGTYDNLACQGLIRNFGFNDATFYERKSYTDQEWMNMIFQELSGKCPILYGGDDLSMQSGHCFLFDGYDATGKVHVNWGWEGQDDGYFDISTLTISGMNYSANQDMVIGIQGNGSSISYYALDINLNEAGTLADTVALKNVPLDSIAYITLSGTINDKDIATIRTIGRNGALRKLDLEGATIVDGLLPDSAFANCQKLRYVTLPECVSKIGNYAFTGCNTICEMRLYNREKPVGTSNIFKGVNLSNATLLVRAGTSTRFSRSLPWKNFGHIGEFGIAVSARNCSRDFGQPNPQFYWNVEGGTIDGEPEITCEATENSPAGKYTLHICRGTVQNPEVDFVDGYMIINEADPDGIEEVSAGSTDRNSVSYDITGRKLSRYPHGTIVITNSHKYIAR